MPQAIQSLEPTKLKPPARVTAIAAGGDHSMAVTVGGALLAFGANKHGQLGTGDTLDRMVPIEVSPVWVGGRDSCLAFLSCWCLSWSHLRGKCAIAPGLA